jgi:hypothetical protein
MRHKHADLIHAWAEGAEIETFSLGRWQYTKTPSFCLDMDYRIKPTPKPDRVCKFEIAKDGTIWLNPDGANIKLTFDGETGELKSAEVLK